MPGGKTMKRNVYEFLIELDNDLWDLMGIESGSDFMNEDGSMNEKFNAYSKAVQNELEAFNIKSVSKKIYEKLEDINCHTMNRALKELKLIA